MLSLNPKKCTAFAAACMLSLSIPGFACAATTVANTPTEVPLFPQHPSCRNPQCPCPFIQRVCCGRLPEFY